MNDIELGFAFLVSQSLPSLLMIFWYSILFEFPRYVMPFAAAGLAMRDDETLPPTSVGGLKVSVMLIGHNEEDAIEACVRSLREQSYGDFDIIVVSDGSTDRMGEVGRRLVREGLISGILSTRVRGGKSSGINLAWNSVRGDIIINVDCDCSFDRHAVEYIIQPFLDPRVGVVCGDVAPRNAEASIIAQLQEIEYVESISVGKRIGNAMDQISCASGAFSAFRREALEQVGGFDAGGGEDLDITLRIRMAGWKSVFQPHAVCYTDVPTSAFNLIRQRMRWERDSVWIRYRKHIGSMNPFRRDFRMLEAMHQWDFLLFSVVGAAIFPAYLVWLTVNYGSFAPAVLIAMQIGLLTTDIAILAISAWVTRRPVFWRNLAYLPAYSLFMTYVMRPVRLIAYVDEMCFTGSHRDNYTPRKVQSERPW